ncbi:hypothetical protein LQW54_004715 [Pestalotiopsis sp. IQ-011]
MGDEPSSGAPVRRYEQSPDMYSDAKIRQAIDDGVKWEQIAMQMFKVENVESTKNRKIGEYISTASSTDRRRRPAECITHALIAAPSDRARGTSEDPVGDRLRYLYERGYFMVMIKSVKGALFVDPCVDLMWSRSRGYEFVMLDGDGEEDDEDTHESQYLAVALNNSRVQRAIDQAGEGTLPMVVRSRTSMPDDFMGSVRWAKTQLYICGKDHDCCVPPAEQLLPTRVLALETNEQG